MYTEDYEAEIDLKDLFFLYYIDGEYWCWLLLLEQ